MGAWATYGLGSESQDLPSYIVLTDPGGHPVDGVRNWSNGWLPALFQGTVVRPQEPRILNLDPPPHLKGTPQERALDFLARLNERHLAAYETPGQAVRAFMQLVDYRRRQTLLMETPPKKKIIGPAQPPAGTGQRPPAS